VSLFNLEQETPHSDGWAVITSRLNDALYLCPRHRLDLADFGFVCRVQRKHEYVTASGQRVRS
jgi:hypothetical protein